MFSVTTGLDLPHELTWFWFEHYIAAFANPLALSLSGRYHSRNYFNFHYRIIGFAFFSLYHRVVLTPFSLLTWANLDQTLCHAESDPFYPMLGKWYLLAADAYLFVGSSLLATIYLAFIELCYQIRNLIVPDKAKKE